MTAAESDVIVVGAGILGVSVAHHLQERGAGTVVVLDARASSSGTSGAGAGFVGLWAAGYADFFTETDLELEQYGIDFYRRMSDEGADINLRTNGNLYAATEDDAAAKWVKPMATHPMAPVGTRELTGADVEGITCGVLSAEAVVGAVLHPAGIQISAGRATRSLADRVRSAGGEIRTETEVIGLLVSSGRVVGVRTIAGDLRARSVVLACGAWTNEVLADVDVSLPMLHMVASRVISPPSGVSPTMPTVMVPNLNGLWLREHRGGLTWGNGDGYAPLFEIGGELPAGQPRRDELVERLVSKLGPDLRALVPIHDTSVGWWLQGVPCMTPDRHFYAGPVPSAPGLFVVGGDNEAGVTHGPGLGRMLAEMVTDGACSWMEATDYRTDRYDGQHFPTQESVLLAMPRRR